MIYYDLMQILKKLNLPNEKLLGFSELNTLLQKMVAQLLDQQD